MRRSELLPSLRCESAVRRARRRCAPPRACEDRAGSFPLQPWRFVSDPVDPLTAPASAGLACEEKRLGWTRQIVVRASRLVAPATSPSPTVPTRNWDLYL